MVTINAEPDYEYQSKLGSILGGHYDPTTEAIKELQEAVVEAFRNHDRDLRSEVEKVNRQVGYLIGAVLLVGLWTGYRYHSRFKSN